MVFICIRSDWDGDIIPLPTTASQYLINTMLWMKKEAYEDSTIKCVAKRLEHLARYSTLADPEAIKAFVANKECSNAYKESLIEAYAIYMRSIGKTWNQPFYNRHDKLPKIPTEEKLNMLISKASPRMALFLAMSKDLGSRPIELTWLKVRDINLENGIVNITGAKHTIGRNGKLKTQTLEMLRAYVNSKHLNQDSRVFPTKSENISEMYRRTRNDLAKKLGILPQEALERIKEDIEHDREFEEYVKTEEFRQFEENADAYMKEMEGIELLRTALSEIAKELGVTLEEALDRIAKGVDETIEGS